MTYISIQLHRKCRFLFIRKLDFIESIKMTGDPVIIQNYIDDNNEYQTQLCIEL